MLDAAWQKHVNTMSSKRKRQLTHANLLLHMQTDIDRERYRDIQMNIHVYASNSSGEGEKQGMDRCNPAIV